MKPTSRLLIIPLIYLCSLLVVNAQTQTPTPQSTERTAEQLEEVKTTFDSTKNETTVEIVQLLLVSTEAEKVVLSVTATYDTKTPKNHPEDVIFMIMVMNPKGFRYPDVNALNITADGKKLPPVVFLNLDKRRAHADFLEALGTRMKYEVFMQLANAKKAELQFSTSSVTLTEEQQAKLRQLAALLHL